MKCPSESTAMPVQLKTTRVLENPDVRTQAIRAIFCLDAILILKIALYSVIGSVMLLLLNSLYMLYLKGF